MLVAVAHVGGPAISLPLNQCMHDYRPGDRCGWSGEQGRQALLDPCECTSVGLFKLKVYEFPKDKLVYGPFQIEARINQNTDISQQISLWNQMGSRVIRGNLLVVPIENSLLYVSPLYLRAESGQLPELKRVIAAYGDRVVMEESLPVALAALFKESVPVASLPANAGPSTSGPADERARDALGHNDRAINRLKVGTGAGSVLNWMRCDRCSRSCVANLLYKLWQPFQTISLVL